MTKERKCDQQTSFDQKPDLQIKRHANWPVSIAVCDPKCRSECYKVVYDWKYFTFSDVDQWLMKKVISTHQPSVCLYPFPTIFFSFFSSFTAISEKAPLLCHTSVWILNSSAVFELFIFLADLNNSLIIGGNLPYFSAASAEHVAWRTKYLPHTLCLGT